RARHTGTHGALFALRAQLRQDRGGRGEEPGGLPGRPGSTSAVIAGYAIAYLWWERTGLGSETLRDLVGNVGFMPFNLACLVLNGLASRNPTLDPAVRRALRLLAFGGLSVLIRNTVSLPYLLA